MIYEMKNFGSKDLEIISLNTVVVGTGAAGFNAADCLFAYGQQDIAIVTDCVDGGTSRNAGSDKQTYYKLTLSGGDPDSVQKLAKNLFAGECVDGDIALIEAALSVSCFLKLCELGVPFPINRYGEYIGYKTDHDTSKRATTAGPYTSRMMTEQLEKAVVAKGIPIFDGYQVISVLTCDGNVRGLLCYLIDSGRFVVFNCQNVIFATGGPAAIYADVAYPYSQYGATGTAFRAGIAGRNLTEWQYGLASIRPRWNVSGTYMQVLPRFISTNAEGNDTHEFLNDFFTNRSEIQSKIFLKGYQWPFDCRKINGGSSIIDILVYIETCIKGRRVFLDFRSNADGQTVDFNALSDEARNYLTKAGANFGTPIERLHHMNAPAVNFYLDKGIDLSSEPLEITLCAQHNNGGLGIDKWWQTNISGFFAVGEVAASHGVYRPGGSALNAGQVGSMRAAQFISKNRTSTPLRTELFLDDTEEQIIEMMVMADRITKGSSNIASLWKKTAKRMSIVGGSIRNFEALKYAAEEVKKELTDFCINAYAMDRKDISEAYRLYDVLVCQYVYLSAMANYAANGGKSRGSALYYDAQGHKVCDCLPEQFRTSLDEGQMKSKIQEVIYEETCCRFTWCSVRPIPEEDNFFENVWRDYRKNGNIY